MSSIATNPFPYHPDQRQPTEWYHATLRSVSLAAKQQNCFPSTDYINSDENLLDLTKPRFARLHDWLAKKDREARSPSTSEVPVWQHIDNGKWRLTFQGLEVSPHGSKGTKRVLTSVIISGGLEPEDERVANRGGEWQLVGGDEGEEIPAAAELPKNILAQPRRCVVM